MVSTPNNAQSLNVGLFVTCLVDLFRPSIGFATVKLLEDNGCIVSVPENQTCCGQPAYNSGDQKNSIEIAKQVISAFKGFDYVVLPSGSCAAMISQHYPLLFKDDSQWEAPAKELATKTFELTTFLTDILKVETVEATFEQQATYHDSCSGLRELGIKNQPRKLLSSVKGLELKESKKAEECCGFGGSFSVKYPKISERIVRDKIEDAQKTETQTLIGGDLGCLMNMAGKLKRENAPMEVRHVAEVLAGMTDVPAIGEGEDK
ncbi:MAG: (Fe-S)-binding protein [Rhodospirillales bacterium]|nr:(Fe-S)-binding protein [Rhodospirillales bacterium]